MNKIFCPIIIFSLTINIMNPAYAKEINWKQFVWKEYNFKFQLPDYLRVNTDRLTKNTSYYFIASDDVNYTITLYAWKAVNNEKLTAKDVMQMGFNNYTAIYDKKILKESEVSNQFKSPTILGIGNAGRSVYFYITGFVIPNKKSVDYCYMTFAWWDLPNYNNYHEKISREILEKVQTIKTQEELNLPVDINSRDNFGNTSLHTVVLTNDLGSVQEFINKKADVNALNNGLSAPLHLAADKGYFEIAEYLIKNGANVNLMDKWGRTPLHLASNKGFIKIIQALLANKADLNLKDANDRTPLSIIVRKKNLSSEQIESAKILIKNGADINTKIVCNKNNCNYPWEVGRTPLHWAIINGHTQIAKLLISEGANIDLADNKGETPLHFACLFANYEIFKLLDVKKANLNPLDKNGDSPLILLTKTSFPSIGSKNGRKFFINALKGRDNYFQALDSYGNRFKIAYLLLNKGADINTIGSGKMTALHWAAYNGFLETVILLIQKGAKIDVFDKDQMTPLYLAVREGHTELALYLLHKQAKANIQVPHNWQDNESDKRFITPLHWSAKNGMEEVTELLIKGGADLNIRDRDGMTPLYLSAREGHVNIVKMLLEKGADSTIKDNNEYGPMDIAKNEEIKKLLTQYTKKV